MIFSLQQIKQIKESELNLLKENQVAENKNLEYKLVLPNESYEEKKEFLADASSFANADGGVIIYGIKEENGVPIEIPGLDVEDIDKEILRLENLLRTSIEPRLNGVLFQPLKLTNEKFILVAHIPNSFNPPHNVNFQKHWRFYSRNSAGKYPIDVSELKSIVSLSSTVRERIRNFRIERISKIRNKDLQIPVSNGPKFICHLIPFSSFATDIVVDIASFERAKFKYELFYNLPKIYNYDGILIHNHEKDLLADWYVQILRNGVIEIFTSRLHRDNPNLIARNGFEKNLIENIPKYLSVLEYFELSLPVIVYYTILNIEGYKIQFNEHERMREMQNRPLSPNNLLLPEVVLDEDGMANLPLKLKPLFDPIWNAAGFPQSPNFNSDGEWTVK